MAAPELQQYPMPPAQPQFLDELPAFDWIYITSLVAIITIIIITYTIYTYITTILTLIYTYTTITLPYTTTLKPLIITYYYLFSYITLLPYYYLAP